MGSEAEFPPPHGGGDEGHGQPRGVLRLLQHAGGRTETEGETYNVG